MGSSISLIISILSILLAVISTYSARSVRSRLESCEKKLSKAQAEIGKFRAESAAGASLRQQIRVERRAAGSPVLASQSRSARWKRKTNLARSAAPLISPARIVAQRLLTRGEEPEVVSQKVLLPVTEILELRDVIFPRNLVVPQVGAVEILSSASTESIPETTAIVIKPPVTPIFERELAIL